jgi:hypothetical protein
MALLTAFDPSSVTRTVALGTTVPARSVTMPTIVALVSVCPASVRAIKMNRKSTKMNFADSERLHCFFLSYSPMNVPCFRVLDGDLHSQKCFRGGTQAGRNANGRLYRWKRMRRFDPKKQTGGVENALRCMLCLDVRRLRNGSRTTMLAHQCRDAMRDIDTSRPLTDRCGTSENDRSVLA